MLTILQCQDEEKIHIFKIEHKYPGNTIFKKNQLESLCHLSTADDCESRLDTYSTTDEAKRVLIFLEGYICPKCMEAVKAANFVA